MNTIHSDVLIVGAGMCGLMAATVLTDTNHAITLLDKGRSVGGRLATRRIGPGRADHGAQFFTVREVAFQRHVDQWLADDVIFKWSAGWTAGHKPDGQPIYEPDGYPRYAAHGGFNALAKHLAAQLTNRGVDIQVNTAVSMVRATDTGWRVTAADAETEYTSEALILTAPVPQSLALLRAGDTRLNNVNQTALERLSYNPTLTGLFWVDGEVNLPEPGAAPRPGGIISFIGDNQRKGISPEARLITLHATSQFSRQHYGDPDAVALPPLRQALEPYLTPGAVIREMQLKRWRYAEPEVLHRDRYLRADELPPLYFGGDVFGGPRVEGAALSGLAMGAAIARG